jgi:hypothetical protein
VAKIRPDNVHQRNNVKEDGSGDSSNEPHSLNFALCPEMDQCIRENSAKHRKNSDV